MNCKPGDMAIVVKGDLSAGRIVRCVRLLSLGDTVKSKCGKTLHVSNAVPQGPLWLLEGYVCAEVNMARNVLEVPACPDSHLRPIRPSDAPDETLAWKPVPATPETAPAAPSTVEPVAWKRFTMPRREVTA